MSCGSGLLPPRAGTFICLHKGTTLGQQCGWLLTFNDWGIIKSRLAFLGKSLSSLSPLTCRLPTVHWGFLEALLSSPGPARHLGLLPVHCPGLGYRRRGLLFSQSPGGCLNFRGRRWGCLHTSYYWAPTLGRDLVLSWAYGPSPHSSSCPS